MEFFYLIMMLSGIMLLIAAAIISDNKFVFLYIAAGICLVLVFNSKIQKLNKGEPASSLNVLTNGEKYEVVDIYEKYIIIKSATDNGNNEKLRFIGPLDFGTRTLTTGRYVKTKESLKKIE